jgi:hypothetical protein
LALSAIGRTFIVLFGLTALIWAALVLPMFWRHYPGEKIANRIIAGEPFKAETLRNEASQLEDADESAFCRPIALRSLAVIRLALMEQMFAAGESEQIDSSMDLARERIRRSLTCSPADPYLWLVLYSLENMRSGFDIDHQRHLRTSYMLGPHEGWIARKRNRLAFAVFERLSPDLADAAIGEFVGLLKTRRLYAEVADIFVGPAWRACDRILPRLQGAGERERQAFAKVLYARGYDIPGLVANSRNHRR